MPPSGVKAQLAEARAAFRLRMEQGGAARVWKEFSGRIAAVLSGGGARGAYEAGVLLAFEDACLPTHVVTATSVASINASSYAAHSDTLVGNAESLVESWFDLTPPAVGIEWTRYVWMLAGLIAASAGFGNLLGNALASRGFAIHLHDPALTWFALGLAGIAVLLLYDQLPYIGYVVRNFFRTTSWKPDARKTALSIVANLIVWSFLLLAFHSLHVHTRFRELLEVHPAALGVVLSAIILYVLLQNVFRAPLSAFLHRLLRLPLRAGLFANFERGRFLRQRISTERLRASPIHVVFTATDLGTGAARFFSNKSAAELAAYPKADARFIAEEIVPVDDLIRAVVASSALPIAYEPMTLGGCQYTDGALVANQPIRPALRLGADVLFLVMMEPPQTRSGEMKTFIDVGLRALDILMLTNLVTDLKILNNVNAACEQAAAERGVHPEEVEIDLGTRHYRWAKCFTVSPVTPLGGTVLDFGGGTTGPAILQGYRDACAQIENFLAYAPQARFGHPKKVLRYTSERDPSSSGTGR